MIPRGAAQKSWVHLRVCDKACQWVTPGSVFFLVFRFPTVNTPGHHDIAKIL